jgi:para-nitrobenzyl esterase
MARTLGWAPVVDGKIIPTQIFDPTAPEVSADVPMIVGTVLNEFTNGIDKPDAFFMDNGQLFERLRASFGDKSKDILDTFRRGHPAARPFDLYSIIMASSVRGNAVKQAQRKAALGKAPAYLYWFTWQTPVLDGRPMAFHCAELSFCFDNTERCETMTGGGPRARALAAKVSDAWINFARNGDPNHPGLPKWQAFDAERVQTMILDDRCELRNDPDGPERRLMDSLQSA